MKYPASRRKRASMTIGIHRGFVMLIAGPNPFLWVGNHLGECCGVISKTHVKKLRDMCNEILARRELEKTKASKER